MTLPIFSDRFDDFGFMHRAQRPRNFEYLHPDGRINIPAHGEEHAQGITKRIFGDFRQFLPGICDGTFPQGTHPRRIIIEQPLRNFEMPLHVDLEQSDDLPGILPFLVVRNKPLASERDDDTQDHGQKIGPERLPAFAFK